MRWDVINAQTLENSYGWPHGITPEVAQWVSDEVEAIIQNADRVIHEFMIYDRLRFRPSKPAPEAWTEAVLLDYRYAVINRALRGHAQQGWVRDDSGLRLATASQWDELTARASRRTFVHGSVSRKGKKTATYCPDCIPEKLKSKLGEDWVDTWLEGSDGWTSAPVCDDCRSSILVIVNGNDTEKKED